METYSRYSKYAEEFRNKNCKSCRRLRSREFSGKGGRRYGTRS
jgi:hypothetical protein